MRNICSEFFTLENYLSNENHLNRSQISRDLVEYLISKIPENPEIKCLIQKRGDKAIIFAPISLIKAGKAEPGMSDKNIITVWYLTNRIVRVSP